MNKWWASDYYFFEKLLYLRDRILTPSGNHRGNFEPIFTHTWLNPEFIVNRNNKLTVAFLGDLMPLKGKQLILSDELKDTLHSSDLIVVNLEGIITQKKRFLALSHDSSILDIIDGLSDKAVKLINVANNHAGDFGMDEFYSSIEKIKEYGFPVMGFDNYSTFQMQNLNLFSSSYWSNQQFNTINRFTYKEADDINARALPGHFNLFLPHWGYEMQLYPTRKQKNFAKQLNNWDMIIGNHSHCPQPIERLNGSDSRFAAYSLGNLCYAHYNPNHYSGSILKVSIDTGPEPKIINYEYHLTSMDNTHGKIAVSHVPRLEYGKLRKKVITMTAQNRLRSILPKAQ